MAISYGAYSQRARFGIEITMSPTTVTAATSSVTLTYKVYLQSSYSSTPGYAGSYTLSRTGTGPTGSGSVSVYTQGTTPQLLGTWTQSVTTSYTSTVSRSMTVSFTSSLFDGATPTHTASFTVPQRPPQLPSQATAASATYNSDSRIDLAWTRPANATGAGTIWSNVVVQRQSAGSSVWSTIATLSGTATSYADTTVAVNQRWRYRIAGSNATGVGTYRETGYISTSPAAPTAVTAAKDANGDIVVTWQDNSAHETGFQVQDGTTDVGSPTASPWTHVSPNPSVTHQYRVRAVVEGPRYSAWSAYSNTVTLLAAPAAPTNLTPNGTSTALDNPLVLGWTHVPIDTTPQTAYELRHRPLGGSWTSVNGTTATTRSITSYSSPVTVEWQVHTKGQHANYGPWSAVATVPMTWKPTATLSSPSASVTGPSATLTWSFYHAGGNAQTGWQTEVVVDGAVLAAGSGTGTTSTWKSPSVIPNGVSGTARVRVREASGLWSDWDTQAFTVTYVPPAESTVTADWQDGLGYTLITAYAVTESGKPATVTHDIERSVDGGETWTLIGEDLGTSVDFVDNEAPAGGTYHYRVTAFSASPSAFQTVVAVTVPTVPANNTLWISGGAGYGVICALPFAPQVDVDTGRSRSLLDFDGRTHPVEFAGRQVPYTLSVSGTLTPDHVHGNVMDGLHACSRDELETLFALPGPHLYRDPSGRVVYGSVSSIRWSRDPGGNGTVSFSITRVARPTVYQEAVLAGYYDSNAWVEL